MFRELISISINFLILGKCNLHITNLNNNIYFLNRIIYSKICAKIMESKQVTADIEFESNIADLSEVTDISMLPSSSKLKLRNKKRLVGEFLKDCQSPHYQQKDVKRRQYKSIEEELSESFMSKASITEYYSCCSFKQEEDHPNLRFIKVKRLQGLKS